MDIELQTLRRVQRVKAAGWLSFPDMCLHCGYGETKMKALAMLKDFPQPSVPTGSGKERRWNKIQVDEWMMAHQEQAA